MQPIHQIHHQIRIQAESAKSYETHGVNQEWHFAIRLRHNQQICVGKGETEAEARQEAEERAIAYLRGAGIWKEEAESKLMNFGTALEHLKYGKKVTRQGWNGKGMWLSVSGYEPRKVDAAAFWSIHNAEYAASNGGYAIVAPCLTFKNAKGEIVMGWTPSSDDLFAEDWVIL